MQTTFRRILVPHDFSDAATYALKVAAGLAARSGGRLTVLHVVTPFQPVTELPDMAGWLNERDLLVGARRELARLVSGATKGVPVECRAVLGDPYRRIAAAARKADLVVMATEGRTGLSHLIIGSVAEKVVRHSPAPVLTVHAPRQRMRVRAAIRPRRERARAARRR